MGLLDGGIASLFGSVFGAIYLDGALHRDGTTPIYDSEGNITSYVDEADIPCKAQVDAATWAMRQSDGFAEGDMMIIVLAAGLGVEISTDMQISVAGKRWSIQSAAQDAAASHWILRGRAA
jgi:hypothetical protein